MSLLLADQTKKLLEAAAIEPAGAYIFHGPKGVGKYSSAIRLAQRLNCLSDRSCRHCRAIAAGNFPDLVLIEPEGSSIGIAAIKLLQHQLALTLYYESGYRIVLINAADCLTVEAQNCLLKTLEEPNQKTTLILISETPGNFLPTVRSRCQTIFFPPLSDAAITAWLQTELGDRKLAKSAAGLSGGAAGAALELARTKHSLSGLQQLDHMVSALAKAETIERLIQLPQLVEAGLTPRQLIDAWFRYLHRNRPPELSVDQAKRYAADLAALEKYRSYVTANVNPRAGLEGLMLELTC